MRDRHSSPEVLLEHRPRRSSFVAVLVLLAAVPSAGAAAPRFGDSTWVAPYPVADSLAVPPVDGPRVASPDHDSFAENALRAPFRLVFLPLRLSARAVEGLLGTSAIELDDDPFEIELGSVSVRPSVNYSGTAGFSVPLFVTVPRRSDANTRFRMQLDWTTNDHRYAEARLRRGRRDAPWSVALEGDYAFRPNVEFYGIGTFTRPEDRSIYLEERGYAQVSGHVGSSLRRQLRASAGISGAGGRRGYGDEPDTVDVYDPTLVPFLGRATDLAFGTLAGDLAWLDNEREPSAGVHLSGSLTRYQPIDDSDVRFWETRAIARTYLPVFARHRVLALQAQHWHTGADRDADPVPFYRLPRAADLDRFAAYPTGRFVDRHLASLRAEYRWSLFRSVMAVGFAELGWVAPYRSHFKMRDVHESYGGGVRLTTNPYTTVRAEFATGAEGTEFGVRFGGVF